MLTVHHLNNSRSQRVLWMLEELEEPYEIVHHARDAKTNRAPAALRAVHPLGKAPVLVDGDRVVAETGSIIAYLLHSRAGDRMKGDSPENLTYWLHYAEGSAMPPLVMKLIFSMVSTRSPALIRPLARKLISGPMKGYIDPEIRLHADYWEKALDSTGWFAGPEISAADIMMSFPLEAASSRGSIGPRAHDFLDRIHARPAYRRALENGGPYAYA
ncbi:glutathione S-transferase [Gimibacter soli]|uniref:glutathione transferase n=1 Tax=Gimibacter soli TaxID=3024400 RepID=A0AAF0BLR2_9PROT|nr:glutathione S-transferase [Gimibacter soli]WCL53760.1 glutathione S-transferase [Gimibacter soli]